MSAIAAADSTERCAPISVLIVDDHPLLREGLVAVIHSQPDMRVVAEAQNGLQALESFRRLHPDVTLMDLQMPDMDGISATAAICREFSDARIIMLTTYRGDAQALRALKAGARGYLLKNMVRTNLLAALRSVHAGERYIPREIESALAAHVTDSPLSSREVEVIKQVAEGFSNRSIAHRLFVSEETVKSHMKNIMGKLAANDRTHAVMIALKRGIIEI